MAISITADSQDELHPALKASAKQVDGKWVVAELPAGWAVEDVKGLVSTVGTERGARKTLAGKLAELGWELADDGKTWKQEGVSAKEAIEALDAVKTGKVKSSKEIEDFKAELMKSYSEKEKGLASKADKYRSQLERNMVEQAAMSALAKHGGAKAIRVLLPLVKQSARVEESADGTLRTVLYDEEGKQRFSLKSGAAGAPMDLEEWVEELRGTPEFKPLFEAKVVGGSGSSSQTGGSGRAADKGSAQAMSARELIQRANESTAAGARG